MREMKNSGVEWIGEIPVEWSVLPTKRFFRNVKRVAGKDADNYERLALTLKGVIKRSKTDNEGLQPEQFESYQVLKENEMVFKLIDLENVKTSRVGLSSYTGLVSPAYIVLTNENKDNRFYYYWFISMYYNEVFNHLGGSGVRSALNAKDLLNIPIPNINEAERKKISDLLDEKCAKIDAVIEKQKQVIKKLKEYKLSVITEAVTKGLDPTVPMKDSGVEWIGEIPEDWNIGKLRFFSEKIGDGLHGTPNFGSGDCFFVNGNNLGKRKIQIKQDTKTVDDIEYFKYRINLNTNTLLISLNGTIGSISEYHNEKLILGKSAGYIIVSDNYSKDYLRYYLQGVHAKTIYELSFAGTTINNLSLETLRNLPVCVFDINKQQEIARFLDKKSVEIDSAIDKKRTIVEKLTEYKKSLIYEVVTGKREV